MLVAAIVIASLLAGFGAWTVYRRYGRSTGDAAAAADRPKGRDAAASTVTDNSRVESANSLLTERLWKLAFSAPTHAQSLEAEHVEIRKFVSAILECDTVDPKLFPRRPTLMPQLLRVVEDPRTATEKISRMVAHDPVLTSDILRLANSPLYRTSPAPIETIQRAIVVLGVDALRGLVATAMLQPVFRATRSNFPRFPRTLWERTERAARAAVRDGGSVMLVEPMSWDRVDESFNPLGRVLLGASMLKRRNWFVVVGAAAATVVLVYLPHVIAVGSSVVGYLPTYLNQGGYSDGRQYRLLAIVLPNGPEMASAFIAIASHAHGSLLAVLVRHHHGFLVGIELEYHLLAGFLSRTVMVP